MGDLGGDPACLLGEVCPVCGAIPDPARGHGCSSCAPVPLADVVAASAAVAATRSRTAKTAALAALVARTTADDLPTLVGLLTGVPRQGRVGVGWATAHRVQAPASAAASLAVHDVDAALDGLTATTGEGSHAEREARLRALFGRATEDEADYLRRLFTGELRHGALAGVLTDAVAKAFGIDLAVVRRATMLLGDLGETAARARRGGAGALRAVQLVVGRPVQPMLASPAADLAAALGDAPCAVSVEWKLDGIRVQVHKQGDEIVVFTRNHNDITSRVPAVVDAVRGVRAREVVLDGEAMAFTAAGAPGEGAALRPFFFDCLHRDGRSLLDEPLRARLDALGEVAPHLRIPGRITDDPVVAVSVMTDALGAGHEGVVVKDLDAPYQAGRRGRAWRKVKPVRTVDLVVLAAEWGHGRRTGRL